MKILSCNAGYLLGYLETAVGYVPPPVRTLVGDDAVERRVGNLLGAVVERERPDVICLVEIDQGSYRTPTDGQCRRLVEDLRDRGEPYHARIHNKYGCDGLVGRLPFFRHLGNGVLLREDYPTTAHYLDAGAKRLVTEVELPSDVGLFVVHLSLGSRCRTRQLRELGRLIAERSAGGGAIVTGDFNTYGGLAELEDLLDRTGLQAYDPGETVPSRPLDDLLLATRSLDLFLCSPTIGIDRCDVLDVQVSDHRPIVLEATW